MECGLVHVMCVVWLTSVVEQDGILGNDGDGLTEGSLGDVADVLAIDENATAGDVVEAVQQTGDGTLPYITATMGDTQGQQSGQQSSGVNKGAEGVRGS